MTMATQMELAKPLQALIDARLDTIDRMLLGQIPRADRLAILREVESQIEELLAERETASLTRDDIIEILRQLDPPEAFVPEEIPDPANRSPQTFYRQNHIQPDSRPTQAQIKPSGGLSSRAGQISGIIGFSIIPAYFVMVVIAYLIANVAQSEPVLLVGLGATSLVGLGASLCGIILGIQGRNQGFMPIVGIVASIVTIFLCLSVPIFLLILLVN